MRTIPDAIRPSREAANGARVSPRQEALFVTCYRLLNHQWTTSPNLGRVEADGIHIALVPPADFTVEVLAACPSRIAE
jgi:hypothetical protein